jgi:hypothetical protein
MYFSAAMNGDNNGDAHAGTDQSEKSIHVGHKAFRRTRFFLEMQAIAAESILAYVTYL